MCVSVQVLALLPCSTSLCDVLPFIEGVMRHCLDTKRHTAVVKHLRRWVAGWVRAGRGGAGHGRAGQGRAERGRAGKETQGGRERCWYGVSNCNAWLLHCLLCALLCLVMDGLL